MSDVPNNPKHNWSEQLGLNPDERMVEVQDIAAKRAYVVLVIQMVLLGSYLFFGRGQTSAIFSLFVVALSGLYLLWRRSRLGNGGQLDERAQLTFNHHFRYMTIPLYLVCLVYPIFGGGSLWFLLFFLPTIVWVGTLLSQRVNSWRPWMLWLVVTFLVGIALGLYSVLSTPAFRLSWIVLAILAIIGGGLAVVVYRRPRSMQDRMDE